jgi:hypothetical protein
MLFAIALLDENARDEQLEAMRQMMIESRAIADAAEQDYLEYKEVLARLREWEEACSTPHMPEVIEAAGCSRRCPYCSGNCPYR